MTFYKNEIGVSSFNDIFLFLQNNRANNQKYCQEVFNGLYTAAAQIT